MNDEVLHMARAGKMCEDISTQSRYIVECRYIPNLCINALVSVGPTAVPSYLHDSHPAVCIACSTAASTGCSSRTLVN